MRTENPVSGPPSDTQKSANMALYHETSERFFREWMPHLTEGEMKLVGFVLTQTLGRGNADGHYYEDQLINGIEKKDGSGSWGAGTGLGRACFYRSLKTVVERGLLIKKTNRHAGWILSINPSWNPVGINIVPMEGNVVGLKIPKQTKKQPAPKSDFVDLDEEIVGLNLIPEQSQIDTHSRNNSFQDQPSSSTTFQMVAEAAPRRSFQEENLENSTEAVSQNGPRATRRPRASATPVTAELPSGSNKSSQRGSTKADSKTSPEKAWKDAWKEAHSSKAILETRLPAPWTNIDRAKIATVARKWDEKAYGPFADFIMFTVCNWKTIMRKHFAWMKEDRPAPSQPEVGFLCAAPFLPKIIEAFCDAETLKWVGLDPRVGREIEWQMENGLTREAAILKVAQMHMEEADRKQRAADIATAKRHLAMAELVLDRSRKEVATREKYRPGAQPAKPAQESFAPATDRDPNAPIIAEQADFSAWDLN